jgi:hypothetical protein
MQNNRREEACRRTWSISDKAVARSLGPLLGTNAKCQHVAITSAPGAIVLQKYFEHFVAQH